MAQQSQLGSSSIHFRVYQHYAPLEFTKVQCLEVTPAEAGQEKMCHSLILPPFKSLEKSS